MSQQPPSRFERQPVVRDEALLGRALYSNLHARTTHRGRVELACLPSCLDHYVQQLAALFRMLGKPLTEAELGQLRPLIERNLNEGFRAASGAKLIVQYEVTVTQALQKNLAVNVSTMVPSLADEFTSWGSARQGPLFGSHPDARVMSLVERLGDPAATRVLDVGAGTGRNTLPLARLGFAVDALELTPEFARQIQSAAQAERLPVRVLQADIFDEPSPLAPDTYRLAVLAEVVSHFRAAEQLRRLLGRMVDVLQSGGLLLFNAFLAEPGYQPDALAREMAQVAWASLFTRDELQAALDGLPLQAIADDSVYDYEREHLPPEAWPPTGWFAAWTNGLSICPVQEGYPPIEMRWLLFRRA